MESVFLPNLTNANLIDTRTAHGVNSYSYTVAPNERISIAYIYLTPENTVTLTGGYAPSTQHFALVFQMVIIENRSSLLETAIHLLSLFLQMELMKFSFKIQEILVLL